MSDTHCPPADKTKMGVLALAHINLERQRIRLRRYRVYEHTARIGFFLAAESQRQIDSKAGSGATTGSTNSETRQIQPGRRKENHFRRAIAWLVAYHVQVAVCCNDQHIARM